MDVVARRSPPSQIAELLIRAEALVGRTLGEISTALGEIPGEVDRAPPSGLRIKGKAGSLIERALGASAGSAAEPDFPAIGVELKTIPIDRRGRVRESTFVCTIALLRALEEDWSTSWVRRKLSCVLWVPIEAEPSLPFFERRVGRPYLWRPSPDEERELAADYLELVGLIAIGGTEELTAHAGRHLQVRPKGPNGRARTEAPGPDGVAIDVVPRGFYLRPSFTRNLLTPVLDPAAARVALQRR